MRLYAIQHTEVCMLGWSTLHSVRLAQIVKDKSVEIVHYAALDWGIWWMNVESV